MSRFNEIIYFITLFYNHVSLSLPTPFYTKEIVHSPLTLNPKFIDTKEQKLVSFSLPLFLLNLIHIKMEGLIPLVYKTIMQYKNGKEEHIGSWICDSPSYSYMRLPSNSSHFQTHASFSSSSSPSFNTDNSSATHVIVSSSVQSPHHCLTHRQVAA
ncbi:hypothetical protein Lalb_Chr01g0022701 [Lupinus albus]|uniref:Uncharacterized protein n=1 Tax=Lupinus albus TaxID=3870 RepID=A0A6A4R5R8_LUPAL|nr:hypothetical protein Lalb_Chr01g0022701 [Lupinus albus]